MANCQKCGKELAQGQMFCDVCGTSVVSQVTPTQVQQPAYQPIQQAYQQQPNYQTNYQPSQPTYQYAQPIQPMQNNTYQNYTAGTQEKAKSNKQLLIIGSAVAAVIIIAVVLFLIFGGNSAVNLVKNGEFSAYPGKPIAKTFREGFEENDIELIEENWEDISEEFEDGLEELGEDMKMVRCEYVAEAYGEEQTIIISYLVDMDSEEFIVFTISVDGEITSDEDEIAYLLEDVFE